MREQKATNQKTLRGFAKKFAAGICAAAVALVCLTAGVVPAEAAASPWSKAGGVCYNGKGKVIPNAITRGIDVSAWQDRIDWKKVKSAGIDFAFVRVGHGTHELDQQYINNMKGAAQAGIPVGVYFYSTTTSAAQSVKDAQWVIKSMQGYKVSYPVVVDMEAAEQSGLTNTQRTNIAKVFLEEIEKAGYYPMLYCNTYWYSHSLNMGALARYDKWIANYGDALTAPAGVPASAYTIWQATSGNTAGGLSSTKGLIPGIPAVNDVDIDFGYRDYTKIVTPRTKALDSYTSGSGWEKDASGWRYRLSDGTYLKNTTKVIGGKKYYFKSDGYRATEWLLLNGKYYYCGSDGEVRTGWQNVKGKYYYLGTSGVMRTGLLKLGRNTYLLADSGARLYGWQQYKKYWLYLGSDGSAKRSWQTIGGARYYFRQNGTMLSGLQKIGGRKFYFGDDGKLRTGWFQYTNGKWYLTDASGAILNGWQCVGGKWYYLNPSGSMHTGWLKSGSTYYYLTQNGTMKVGWLKYEGKYYYFHGDGQMAKSQTLTIDGKKYTFNANGVRVA